MSLIIEIKIQNQPIQITIKCYVNYFENLNYFVTIVG